MCRFRSAGTFLLLRQSIYGLAPPLLEALTKIPDQDVKMVFRSLVDDREADAKNFLILLACYGIGKIG